MRSSYLSNPSVSQNASKYAYCVVISFLTRYQPHGGLNSAGMEELPQFKENDFIYPPWKFDDIILKKSIKFKSITEKANYFDTQLPRFIITQNRF